MTALCNKDDVSSYRAARRGEVGGVLHKKVAANLVDNIYRLTPQRAQLPRRPLCGSGVLRNQGGVDSPNFLSHPWWRRGSRWKLVILIAQLGCAWCQRPRSALCKFQLPL